MRTCRLKPEEEIWHHCFNRVVGASSARPFGEAEKEQFVRFLMKVSRLSFVEPVSYQILGNHFHLLLRVPAGYPTEEETCQRYSAYYRGRRTLTPGTEACRRWQQRLRDVSWYLRLIQQLFTVWYNKSRPERRRGPLWAERFKNTLLESGEAVWRCWMYIENNPVRAGLSRTAAGYRFGSFGRWVQRGRHPFEENVRRALLPMMESILGLRGMHGLRLELARELERQAGGDPEDSTSSQTLVVSRRVRYWVDGLVIGSDLFVMNLMRRVRGEEAIARHRLARLKAQEEPSPLFAWRRLRLCVD
ncbi:MAG: hypothetical protein U1E27_12555 [Kiritimatiellia bacterium]|nr:hypothetical protein [Kiritimatiellia bacterium]